MVSLKLLFRNNIDSLIYGKLLKISGLCEYTVIGWLYISDNFLIAGVQHIISPMPAAVVFKETITYNPISSNPATRSLTILLI